MTSEIEWTVIERMMIAQRERRNATSGHDLHRCAFMPGGGFVGPLDLGVPTVIDLDACQVRHLPTAEQAVGGQDMFTPHPGGRALSWCIVNPGDWLPGHDVRTGSGTTPKAPRATANPHFLPNRPGKCIVAYCYPMDRGDRGSVAWWRKKSMLWSRAWPARTLEV